VGVVAYTVWRDGAPVGETDSTSYVDRAVTPGTTHLYTVVAHDAAGNTSAPSSSVSATCPGTANGKSKSK
jgi:endoglucanase